MVLVSSTHLGRIFTGRIFTGRILQAVFYLQIFGTKCCINLFPLSCVLLVSPIPFLSFVHYNNI